MEDTNPLSAKAGDESETRPFPHPSELRQGRMQRRRDKIVDEIQRNRRGEYKVPTWVLGALLTLIIAGIAAIMIFAR